ncbi:probable ubiquitin-conjugating enzyme E2 24 isoform X2 [Diospyros lotus]|uniref:probable ubiquitin-conjugating enzyme E2 24 isoform X2 n=1 Tax=Diospyros lotus TaxID=55363 RepID=UPI002252C171|nr:probable ubiquitin-conjugating enzyme E2 24 isoform X2 [Diospyros lotus]
MDFFSDSDSFSESSISEEQDDNEILYGGQARSILSSLKETIGKIDDFLSFERRFTRGEFVCSVTDPSGQMGRVINVDVFVDLESLHGKIITDVNSERLQKIRSISVGDSVVVGPWLGRVDKVIDTVTILFDDGSKSKFTTMGSGKLLPLSPDLLEDSEYPYYPGQRVRVELSTVSKPARWLCSRWKEKQDKGTICSVEAGFVHVDWLACALGSCESVPAPPCLQDSKNVTLLSCFSHENWQLGDWCVLPTAELKCSQQQVFPSSSICGVTKEQNQYHGGQEIFVIVKTKSKVDVLWQDGSYSTGLSSHSLFPVNFLDAHDFWPGQFVLEKGTGEYPHDLTGRRWGTVRCMDAKERIVRVKWKTLPANQVIDLEGGEQMEETVSAYELVEHPDYSYYLGDIVIRLEKNRSIDNAEGQIYEKHKFKETVVDEEADLESEKCNGENNGYLSHIGIVVGLKDGDVDVKWASGHMTKVAPYEIIQIDKHEGSSPTPVFQGENIELLAQEMTTIDMNPKGKEFFNPVLYSLPGAAIGVFMSIMRSIFGSFGSISPSGIPDLMLERGNVSEGHISESNSEGDVPESLNMSTEEEEMVEDDLQSFGKTNLEQQVKDIQEEKAPLFSSDCKCPEAFKQFDMVTDCLDHHFVGNSSNGLILSQVKRGWLKKVQQEWSILEKNLPETMYIRVYEERMDLLRAVIVGAPGTPYHDGLFFFDIFLPPEYPHEPPLVHYKSGGLRVNPNLYESGKVCLSLLNTWTGTGTEVWSPESSTILQVLLSLQALVLNEKPYFNEAGYDKHMGRAEGEKNSMSYNENAFLLSCKSMVYLLCNPPKHFESFIEDHFSKHAKNILLACKAYMEGARVGCAFGYKKSEQENQQGSSTGFKIMLSKVLPKLVEAFSHKGIDCSQYTYQM